MSQVIAFDLLPDQRVPLPPEPTYSISELNALVRSALRERFPTSVWVWGEIHDYDKRKHRDTVSFTLAEKDPESDDILAGVTAILFPEERRSIEELLARSENAFQLQDGIEVRFRVEVDLWVKAGRFQLRVRTIDPTYTLGRLAQNRRRILELLAQRGLIERNKRVPMPLVPLRIGLIAAKGSAGFTDFVTHLSQSGIAFSVQFIDAAMQGSQVEPEVSRALAAFSRSGAVDVVVITRGGGTGTDLSWFDRLALAEAIATSCVPVLTGLGHTYDTSVADAVAHANLKTPTDAAQFLIDRVRQFLDSLEDASRALQQQAQQLLVDTEAALLEAGRGLSDAIESLLAEIRLWLTDRRRFSTERMGYFLTRERQAVGSCADRITRETLRLLRVACEALRERQRAWASPRVNRAIVTERLHLHAATSRVTALDPAKTLARGFSIIRSARGAIVRRIGDVRIDEVVSAQVTDGMFRSRVQSLEPLEEDTPGG